MSTPQSVLDSEAAINAEIEQLLNQGQEDGIVPEGTTLPGQSSSHEISPESVPLNDFDGAGESIDSILGQGQGSESEPIVSENADGSATEYDELNQKHKSLQGQFRKMQEERGTFERQIADLTGRVETFQNFQQPVAPTEPAKAAVIEQPRMGVNDIYTDEEVEELGPDILKANIKAAQRVADAKTKQLESELADLKKQVNENGEVSKTTAQQAQIDGFWNQIESHVPQGRSVYQTEEFAQWSNEIQSGTGGMTRYQLMDAAANRQDAKGVASFIAEFSKSKSGAKANTDQNVQGQAEPKTSGGGVTTAQQFQPEGRLFTHAEANEFLERAKAGQYGEKTEAVIDEIMNAYSAGRVR